MNSHSLKEKGDVVKILKIMLLAVVLLFTLQAEAPKKVDPVKKAAMLKLKKEMLGKWKAYSKASQGATRGITADELIKWDKEDRDFVLVDVREPSEVAAGKIIAINFKAIPRGMVAPAIGKKLALKPNQTVVFYCKLGSRSAMVAKETADVYGYENIFYLKGGIMGWIKAGHKIENFMGEFSKVGK